MTDHTLRKLWKFAAVGSAILTALLVGAGALATIFYGRLPLRVLAYVAGANITTAILCAGDAHASGSPGSQRLARSSRLVAMFVLVVMIVRLM